MKVLGSYWMKNGFIIDGPRMCFHTGCGKHCVRVLRGELPLRCERRLQQQARAQVSLCDDAKENDENNFSQILAVRMFV